MRAAIETMLMTCFDILHILITSFLNFTTFLKQSLLHLLGKENIVYSFIFLFVMNAVL